MRNTNAARALECVARAKARFLEVVEPLPDNFRASLTRNALIILVEGVEVERGTWRAWCNRRWVFQIEGDRWGKLPAYERARWEE